MMLKVALGKRRITLHVDRMPSQAGPTYQGSLLIRRHEQAGEAHGLILSTASGQYVMGRH